MLERTRSYFENVLSRNFDCLRDHRDNTEFESRMIRKKLRNSRSISRNAEVSEGGDGQIVTRKTRTRRPTIPVLQSGYCAVCNLPYNNVEDHIQSKKHQKLIGGDANYIALNGSLNGFLQNNSIPFLNLNGVDAIGVHETSFEEFSSRCRKRTVPRTRASSVMCDHMKTSPLSPTGSDTSGHHLRSRRNVNYMTPPSDDDSLEEQPDLRLSTERVHSGYKEYRELRSSTKALAKLTEETSQEVWNSGRPKRTCIGKKRHSIDEQHSPTTNCKTFYKVEVVTPKLRSCTTVKGKGSAKRQQSRSPKRDEKEKALIVKFKKMRNSELTQLNNEATNFLFPKKDDESSDKHEDVDVNTIASSVENESNSVSCSDNEDCIIPSRKFKVDDDLSKDSTCSSGKNKKKRRTHAEAFILDNQKYYKFETPGSRLRYHGSYLPPVMNSPKYNGECSPKREELKTVEPEENEMNEAKNAKVKLDNYKFSFEKIPINAPWYSTFRRLDRGEQRYTVFSDYFWDPFILPYQMPSISALDPRSCIHHYSQLLNCIREPSSDTNSRCSTPEHSPVSTPFTYEPDLDEDSKMSVTTVSSLCSIEEGRSTDKRTRSRAPIGSIMQRTSLDKRPRKSPRQHASTLAILSSLIQHRRKRTKENNAEESIENLTTVPEEEIAVDPPRMEEPVQEIIPKFVSVLKPKESDSIKCKIPRKCKPKIDYFSIARQIDEELDTAVDDDLENYELEIAEESAIDFHNSKTTLADVMTLYEECTSKESENSCKKYFSDTPGRKPGRRKKMNKTGWPNKNKRQSKRDQSKEKETSNNNDDNDGSTIDSESVNNDSDEEICEEKPQPTDSIRESDSAESQEVTNKHNCDVDRVDLNDQLLTNCTLQFQPYVCVQKLDSKNIVKKMESPQRSDKRQRHMPGSPKSPRMLRKPRGRWYRER